MRASLRIQALLAVNIAIVFTFLVSLGLAYRNDLAARLADHRKHLQTKAETLLPAVRLLRDGDEKGVREYIYAVSARYHRSTSLSQHIAGWSIQLRKLPL